MNKLLEKIAWKTRRWNYQFYLLNIYLHDQVGTWGINICTFKNGWNDYSLFSFEFRLPNKTHVQRFTVDNWDVLFIKTYLDNVFEDLCDRRLWSTSGLSAWGEFKYNILKRIL